MQEGRKLTHRYFTPGEWVTMGGRGFIFEDGCTCSIEEFWQDRSNNQWNDGWYHYQEPDQKNKETGCTHRSVKHHNGQARKGRLYGTLKKALHLLPRCEVSIQTKTKMINEKNKTDAPTLRSQSANDSALLLRQPYQQVKDSAIYSDAYDHTDGRCIDGRPKTNDQAPQRPGAGQPGS